jgi:hypothetical protein
MFVKYTYHIYSFGKLVESYIGNMGFQLYFQKY